MLNRARDSSCLFESRWSPVDSSGSSEGSREQAGRATRLGRQADGIESAVADSSPLCAPCAVYCAGRCVRVLSSRLRTAQATLSRPAARTSDTDRAQHSKGRLGPAEAGAGRGRGGSGGGTAEEGGNRLKGVVLWLGIGHCIAQQDSACTRTGCETEGEMANCRVFQMHPERQCLRPQRICNVREGDGNKPVDRAVCNSAGSIMGNNTVSINKNG